MEIIIGFILGYITSYILAVINGACMLKRISKEEARKIDDILKGRNDENI